jgi:hypothetical protein
MVYDELVNLRQLGIKICTMVNHYFKNERKIQETLKNYTKSEINFKNLWVIIIFSCACIQLIGGSNSSK